MTSVSTSFHQWPFVVRRGSDVEAVVPFPTDLIQPVQGVHTWD